MELPNAALRVVQNVPLLLPTGTWVPWVCMLSCAVKISCVKAPNKDSLQLAAKMYVEPQQT